MNVNPILQQAFADFDISPAVKDNPSDEYLVYNYADEHPVLRADDSDLLDNTSIQLHFFTRNDPQQMKQEMRRRLRNAGFTIQSTFQYYEDDTKYHHVVVEAWIEGQVND